MADLRNGGPKPDDHITSHSLALTLAVNNVCTKNQYFVISFLSYKIHCNTQMGQNKSSCAVHAMDGQALTLRCISNCGVTFAV